MLLLALLGLSAGSFVNAMVWRLHEQDTLAEKPKSKNSSSKRQLAAKDLSILAGRSMCTRCHHELAPVDLVPMLSWMWLGGKCRYCGKPISWQYPVVELVAAMLFIVSYLFWPFGFGREGTLIFVFWLVFLTAFVALAVYDIRWFLLPDRIVYPLIVLSLGEVLMRAVFFREGWGIFNNAVWGALLMAGLFYIIYAVSRGAWIGFGDVKLAVVLGLLVGGPLNAALVIFVASLLGSLIAVPLLVRGKANGTTHLPFGPFLLAAAMFMVLVGDRLSLFWYNQFLPF